MLSFFRPKNISFGTKAVPATTPQGGGGGWAGWLVDKIYLMRSLECGLLIFGCWLCVHVLLPGRCSGTEASVVAQRVGRNWSERMRRIQTEERALICELDCISNLNLVNCWLFKDLETHERYQKKEREIAVLSLVSLVTALVPLLFQIDSSGVVTRAP